MVFLEVTRNSTFAQLFLMTCIGIFTAKAKIVSDNFANQLVYNYDGT